jgi:hypothetical protein
VFHKPGSTPKTAGGSKNVSKSKPGPGSTPGTHTKSVSNSKPAPAPRTTAASKPASTSTPGAASHAGAEPRGATNDGGLSATKSGGRGDEGSKGGGLLGGDRGTTPGNHGATTGERKAPERSAPEAKAPEAHAAESHAAENHPEENHAEGARTVTRPNGDRAEYNTAGKPTRLTTKSGAEARFDSRGQVRAIHTQDSTIRLGPHGGRTVVTERPDHTRLVSMGPHHGYVDHPIVRNGRPYLERTYVDGGRVYARAYPGYYYHGALYYHYLPAYYYAPAFYVWAVRPWHSRVVFAWNWGPWRGYYGSYFSPYPNYADCPSWITDYVIAQDLSAAYDAQQQAPAISQPIPAASGDDSAAAPLSPAVKQAIADEVTAQLNAEKASALNPLSASSAPPASGDAVPDALNPSERTFIADISLDAAARDGADCSVGPGDVLTRVGNAADADQKVNVVVRSSQKGDCAMGTQVAVPVADLQDMANHFHEKVDDGVGQLTQNQGQNGMPAAPPADPVQVADAQAKPDLDAQRQLQQQQHSADQIQKNVQQSVGQLDTTSSRLVIGKPSATPTIETSNAAIVPSNFKAKLRARRRIATQ